MNTILIEVYYTTTFKIKIRKNETKTTNKTRIGIE